MTDAHKRNPMLVAAARIEIERPGRYLVQLCQHVEHLARSHDEMRARVEWSEQEGVIDFGWGRCVLTSEPGSLSLRAEADSEAGLRRMQQRVTERLERFGRNDGLTVTWNRADGSAHDQGDEHG